MIAFSFNYLLPQIEYANIQFHDLKTLATVGIGGFGRVILVKYTKDNALKIFALKQMKKVHILETKQVEHVFNERRIMLSCKFFWTAMCAIHACFIRMKQKKIERMWSEKSNFVL